MKIRNIFHRKKDEDSEHDLEKCETRALEVWKYNNFDKVIITDVGGIVRNKGNSSFETFLIAFYPSMYTLFYNAFLKYTRENRAIESL